MALAAFSAMAIDTSDFVIDEGKPAGDVNNDERVNVSDVSALINMILGSTAMDQSRADVNGDGRVNVSDVTELINIILGNTIGGSTGGSVITMADFIPNSGSTSGTAPLHQWAEGDVIFIAVDPDYSSDEACKNVYAMVRTGGKWVLRDVNGNNKQGFKTSGGTLCAAYVQHADLENSYYDYIPLTGDVACVNKAANYSVTLKDNKFYITIRDLILYHFVSRIDVNAANEGDYFYGSVTHLDALTRIMRLSQYTYGSFETSSRAPVIDIDSQHRGHAYGVWKKGTRTDGWLTLNYAKSNGYAYWWNYTQDELKQGCYLTSIYSPWQNAWNRDLSMQYYNYDDRTTYRQNAGSTYQNVNINVGTNIIFRPWDGATTDDRGTMTSVTSSNSGIIDVNYDNTQVNVTAHKVGTTTLTIKFKTKDGVNTTYTYNVTVNPTVWAAGKSADNKPIVWRNWQDKSGWLGGKDNYVAATRIFVHGSNATVLYRKDNVGYKTYYDTSEGNTIPRDYYFYTGGTAAVAKASGAHGGGYFNIYTSELEGSQHKLNRYFNFEGAPRMWTDKNGNVYYTTSTRSTQTDTEGEDNGCVVNTSLYKNKTKLLTQNNFVITDLAVSESTGKIYVIGNSTNKLKAVASLGVINGTNAQFYSMSPSGYRYWLFTKMYLDQNTETVYIEGLNGIYNTINGGSGYICRYTANEGLSQYSGVDLKTASNYNYVNDRTYFYKSQAVNEGLRNYPFIFNANKFYVFNDGASGNAYNKIYTYQLGTSQIAEYTTYPNGTKPMFFDIKNNMIGMVLFNGAGKPYQVMSCSLNSAKTGVAMENSAGALIYDVYMQTSLDD